MRTHRTTATSSTRGPNSQPYDLPADQQLLTTIGEIHARRCTPCHTSQEVTRADWIDLQQPERSLFLAAPLSTTTTGRKCAQPPYADEHDDDYQAVRQLVDDAVKKAWSAPRRDLQGLLSESDVAPDSTESESAASPRLVFERTRLDATLGEAYRQALHNLLDINTIPADMQKYNRTGLLRGDPPRLIRAGGDYQDPWTRDASVNSWNAASLLAPEIARNTLWAVCERLPNGRLIIQRDNQWWDKLIWVTAAWNHFATTGRPGVPGRRVRGHCREPHRDVADTFRPGIWSLPGTFASGGWDCRVPGAVRRPERFFELHSRPSRAQRR